MKTDTGKYIYICWKKDKKNTPRAQATLDTLFGPVFIFTGGLVYLGGLLSLPSSSSWVKYGAGGGGVCHPVGRSCGAVGDKAKDVESWVEFEKKKRYNTQMSIKRW
jgi:hypothetical protein